MVTLNYQLDAETKRKDGVFLSDLEQLDLPLNSIIAVRRYVHGASGSEYHFNLSFDPRIPGVGIFCDDFIHHGSPEYLAVLQKLSARLNTKINPATGEGSFVKPQDKRLLVTILNGIFDDFMMPDKDKLVVIDYRKV